MEERTTTGSWHGIAWETWAFAAVCLVDLISTVCLVHKGTAAEGNPVMSYYLVNGGIISFVAAKALLALGPLIVLERLRRSHPRFIRLLMRSSVAAYVVLYGVGSLIVNHV